MWKGSPASTQMWAWSMRVAVVILNKTYTT